MFARARRAQASFANAKVMEAIIASCNTPAGAHPNRLPFYVAFVNDVGSILLFCSCSYRSLIISSQILGVAAQRRDKSDHIRRVIPGVVTGLKASVSPPQLRLISCW